MTVTTASLSRSPAHSRLRARLVLAGLSAFGLAALAWASFKHPLPRLTYNPSDSVAVGWYRVDPLDRRTSSPLRPLQPPLHVGSIVLVPLPAETAALAAQRGYRSEEHTSELQSPCNLVCRLLLEKKKK